MKNSLNVLILNCLFFSTSFSQWSVGVSYITKNQFPFNGFGINISRNLPFQLADIGFEVGMDFNQFKAREIFEKNNTRSILSYNMINENLSLKGIIFPRYVNHYIGISMDVYYLYHEKFEPAGNSINVSEKEKIMFNLELIGGIQLSIFNLFSPFIEVRLAKYFGSFDEFEFNREISELQLLASFGVILKLDFIK